MIKQILKLLKQRLWLLLPLLGLLSLVTVLLLNSSHPQPPAPVSTIPSPSPSLLASKFSSPSPAAPTPSPVAKSASKAATKSLPKPSPSAQQTAKPSPPSLTAEQKNLNRQYKQSLTGKMASIDALVEIRVAIAEGVPALALGVSNAADLLDQQGKSLHSLSAGTTYTAQADGQTIGFNSWQLPAIVWIDPSPSGVFYLGDRAYHGKLLLVAEAGRLWAVNLVNLRNYLSSVVGSEVSPSWPLEALKAQAVAARSYALTYFFKPANSLYQLGATESYQVYSGIAREADTTRQAVDATAGEFVSYRGGVVESLYAASDDIVAEAFQGRGMSQLGALGLAEQGFKYHQILSNYYPGTGVGRIEQDYE